jgi:hypothetical protein
MALAIYYLQNKAVRLIGDCLGQVKVLLLYERLDFGHTGLRAMLPSYSREPHTSFLSAALGA